MLIGFDQSNNIWHSHRCRKKRSEETQTLRAGYSKAEPKIFAPPQTPFPGTRDDQNLISWRLSLPLPTNRVWWASMHAISSYRGNRPTHTPTHRQDRLQYTAPQLVRSVIISIIYCIRQVSLHAAWCQRHVGMNNFPRVIMQACHTQEPNPQP